MKYFFEIFLKYFFYTSFDIKIYLYIKKHVCITYAWITQHWIVIRWIEYRELAQSYKIY